MVDPRIQEYQKRYHCRLLGFLGSGPGQDGFVQRSSRLTAVKFFDRAERFEREREVYRILQRRGIHDIAGHNVPEYIGEDGELRTLEMSIVGRPFILDFAGARHPHEVPDFEPHVIDEHTARLMDLFGDRYAEVLHVVDLFHRRTGFILLDIHPGNIAFVD